MDEIEKLPRCEKCGKKIDPETPIQIDETLICDICTDAMNTD